MFIFLRLMVGPNSLQVLHREKLLSKEDLLDFNLGTVPCNVGELLVGSFV